MSNWTATIHTVLALSLLINSVNELEAKEEKKEKGGGKQVPPLANKQGKKSPASVVVKVSTTKGNVIVSNGKQVSGATELPLVQLVPTSKPASASASAGEQGVVKPVTSAPAVQETTRIRSDKPTTQPVVMKASATTNKKTATTAVPTIRTTTTASDNKKTKVAPTFKAATTKTPTTAPSANRSKTKVVVPTEKRQTATTQSVTQTTSTSVKDTTPPTRQTANPTAAPNAKKTTAKVTNRKAAATTEVPPNKKKTDVSKKPTVAAPSANKKASIKASGQDLDKQMTPVPALQAKKPSTKPSVEKSTLESKALPSIVKVTASKSKQTKPTPTTARTTTTSEPAANKQTVASEPPTNAHKQQLTKTKLPVKAKNASATKQTATATSTKSSSKVSTTKAPAVKKQTIAPESVSKVAIVTGVRKPSPSSAKVQAPKAKPTIHTKPAIKPAKPTKLKNLNKISRNQCAELFDKESSIPARGKNKQSIICVRRSRTKLIDQLRLHGGYNPRYVATSLAEALRFEDVTKSKRKPKPKKIPDKKKLNVRLIPFMRILEEKLNRSRPKRHVRERMRNPLELWSKDDTTREDRAFKHKLIRRLRRSVNETQTTLNGCWGRGTKLDGQDLYRLCTECHGFTRLANTLFPPFINEGICGDSDKLCAGKFGMCEQKELQFTFLTETAEFMLDEGLSARYNLKIYTQVWKTYQQSVRSFCVCRAFAFFLPILQSAKR